MSRYTTVIFDFGGVITASPFEAFNRLEAERGLPHDFVRRVNATNPDNNAWAKFERAEIDAAAFDALFAEGRQTADPEKRKDIYAKVSKNLEDNAAWIWLFTSYTYTATASTVDGFAPMANGSSSMPVNAKRQG